MTVILKDGITGTGPWTSDGEPVGDWWEEHYCKENCLRTAKDLVRILKLSEPQRDEQQHRQSAVVDQSSSLAAQQRTNSTDADRYEDCIIGLQVKQPRGEGQHSYSDREQKRRRVLEGQVISIAKYLAEAVTDCRSAQDMKEYAQDLHDGGFHTAGEWVENAVQKRCLQRDLTQRGDFEFQLQKHYPVGLNKLHREN